jgi:hypothetical protein
MTILLCIHVKSIWKFKAQYQGCSHSCLTFQVCRYCSSSRTQGKFDISHRKLTPWHQKLKVHHRIHKSPPPVPILSQLDPLYTPPADLPKIHSDPILTSTPWSFKLSLSFWPSHQNLLHVPLISHACHMSRPAHSP